MKYEHGYRVEVECMGDGYEYNEVFVYCKANQIINEVVKKCKENRWQLCGIIEIVRC